MGGARFSSATVVSSEALGTCVLFPAAVASTHAVTEQAARGCAATVGFRQTNSVRSGKNFRDQRRKIAQ